MDFPLQFSISSTSLLLTVFETTPSARSLHNVLAEIDNICSIVLVFVLTRPSIDEGSFLSLVYFGDLNVLYLHTNAITSIRLNLKQVVFLVSLLLW